MKYIINAFCWLAGFFMTMHFVMAGLWMLIGLIDRSMSDVAPTYIAECIVIGGLWAPFFAICEAGRYAAANFTICRRNS